MKYRLAFLTLNFCVLSLVSCSGDGESGGDDATSSGGSTSTGGLSGSGGLAGTGGDAAAGGGVGTGGGIASGGDFGAGGTGPVTGGASSGGGSGDGGSPSGGGTGGAGTGGAGGGWLYTEGTEIKLDDGDGNPANDSAIILHGVSMIDITTVSTDGGYEAQLDRIATWNVNIVRMPVYMNNNMHGDTAPLPGGGGPRRAPTRCFRPISILRSSTPRASGCM